MFCIQIMASLCISLEVGWSWGHGGVGSFPQPNFGTADPALDKRVRCAVAKGGVDLPTTKKADQEGLLCEKGVQDNFYLSLFVRRACAGFECHPEAIFPFKGRSHPMWNVLRGRYPWSHGFDPQVGRGC